MNKDFNMVQISLVKTPTDLSTIFIQASKITQNRPYGIIR